MDPKANIERDATWTAAPTESAPVESSKVSTSEPRVLAPRDRQRYDIIAEAGRGGLGRVFRAHDRELGRDVALKELLQRGHAGELRFFREALVTARLEHPGIVPVHEAGRWSDGTPFYAMKLVAGRSLKQLIDDKPALADRLPLIANLIAVADAMAYAHDRRIIHRDLKPANVMVGDFGETIVIDWGLAKALDDDSPDDDDLPYRSAARSELTAAGTSLGTPAYMAPEQFGGKVDQRADIYALGGLLYHVLVGKAPHDKSDARTAAPPSLPREIPEDLAAIVQRAMARDPEARYPTARALALDLGKYQRHDRVSARRYSLLARLGLAFERHRAVATVAMLALVVLSATLGIAAFKIARGRNDAIAAREHAQRASARALLERDPTRALEALEGVPQAAETTLLRARIRASGIAERIVPLPAAYDRIQVTNDGRSIVISTGDRTLSVFDPTNGTLTKLADGLTEPSIWAATNDRAYFVRQQPRLELASVALAGGPTTVVLALDRKPDELDADADRVWWLDGRDLLSITVGATPRLISHDVDDVVVTLDDVVWCRDGKLISAHRGELAGTCSRRDFVLSSRWGFAYAARDQLQVYRGTNREIVDATTVPVAAFHRLTATGLLVGQIQRQEGFYLRPGATTSERVAFASPINATTARDDLAAWGLADGSIEVRDTANQREWRIQAHPDAVWCAALVAGRKLVTCSRSELRVWSIPHAGATTLGKLPVTANTLAIDARHDLLLDGNDGTGYVIEPRAHVATAVHRHDDTAFGAAWCDGQACTSGWDGRVTCSDVAAGTSHVVLQLDSTTAWLATGAGHCFTAGTSGGIYDLRAPDRPIYVHDREPYRVAVATDGSRVASVDWGGGVKVFDVTKHRLVAEANLHAGKVIDVGWAGDDLVTAGVDGRVVVSSPALQREHEWQLGAPARYLAVAGDHFGVGLEDGSLILASPRTGVVRRVATRETLGALAIAPDGSAVAAGTTGGDVVVITANGATAAARFEHGRVSCVAFDEPNVITLCAPSGRVVRIPFDALSFESGTVEDDTAKGDDP